MLCFYHSADLDGHCSGAIVKMRYPGCRMVGIDYGDDFPWDLLVPGEMVFMVDFSLPMADMERLNAGCGFLHWIDHHKTAIAAAKEIGFVASGRQVLEVGRAACELTWDYLYSAGGYLPVPKAVYLLGRYDVWDHVPGAVAFNYGLRLHNTLPERQDFWKMVFDDRQFVNRVMVEGELLLRYEAQQNAHYAGDFAFDLDFEGLRFVALNRGEVSGLMFSSVYDSKKHDAMLGFVVSAAGWRVSLRSDKAHVDVALIAKKYGGGGHAGAAGFVCEDLPFCILRKKDFLR